MARATLGARMSEMSPTQTAVRAWWPRAVLDRLAPVSRDVARVLERPDASLAVPERFAAETRAVQLSETLKLAKFSVVAHVLVAASFVPFFWATQCRTYVVLFCAVVSVLAIAALCSASLLGPRITSAKAVTCGRWVATGFAFVIGIAWGTVPVALLPWSDDAHRIIVTSTMTGVIADVFVLGPIMLVSMFFVFPIFLGIGVGLSLMGGFTGIALLVLLGVFTFFVVFSIKELNKLSVQRIFDRVQVSEQNDTIGLLLREFEESTSDWLWELDSDGRITHGAERLAQAVGLDSAMLQGESFSEMFRIRRPDAPMSDDARKMFTAIAGRRPFHNTVVEIKTTGPSIWWRLTGKPIYDKAGMFVGYRGVGSDITLARSAEAKIAYMANYDALTGLANRAVFVNLASVECAGAADDRMRRALLFLDGFKGVNDSFGHAIGDRLLVDVARRLEANVPSTALLARLGGDEFAVLYRVERRAEAEALAGRLIDELSAPYQIDGSTADIGLSVGIAFAPDDAAQPASLLVKADLALYRAKADGRGRYRVFVEDYERLLNERRAFENDLRLALPRREFELAYQPLVELDRGRVVCVEALLRWKSETRGVVSPVTFIPVAEQIGLIVLVGRWVLWRACLDAAGWDRDVSIAVNISPQHFRMPDFLNDVSVALELSGLEPQRLEIEITEGVFLEGSDAALANLHALRKHGIRIVLDDFGTGFSSLNYLLKFPVDKIKIDRSFVRDFVSRHENRAIIDAILTLARELSIKVTAEGVETVEQAVAMRARRCDHVQGYLLSMPRPAAEIEALMRDMPAIFRNVMPERAAPMVQVVRKQSA